MKVFITGGESFVGSLLWNMLADAGHDVSGIDIVASTRPGCYQADLRDPGLHDLIPDGATVVHLAAISTDPACRTDPLGAFDVNLNGTINLARSAATRNCSQFIFASTEWVYGDVSNEAEQLEEDSIDVTRITSAYAFSKVAGERILFFSGLLNVTVLRFGIIYGQREKNWSAVESLVDSVRRGAEISVGSLKTARRFIDVNDVCRGIIASFGREGFQVFNLAGERLISLGDVLETAQSLVNRRVKIVESQPSRASIRNAVSEKAAQLLGWRPQTSLIDGVSRLLEIDKNG